MKNTILLALLLTFSGLSAQENCEKFKTGNFKISDPKINFECTITRTDSLQIENVLGEDEVSVYKVAWPSECEYTLQMVSGKSEDLEFFKDKILRVKIIATADNNYTYEAQMDGIDLVVSETIYMID